jgi:predicted amidohydrolase
MRIALIQMNLAWEDVAENHRRAGALLADAAREGARLAILPEMFSTGFSMASERIAQPEGGESEEFLRDQARALGIWALASVPQKGEPRPKNVALLVSPSGDVVRYAKIHPFSFGGEDLHYAPGDRVVTATVEGVRVTPFVCYDLRFPEPFRVAAQDTDLFVVVANWPETRREHWRLLLRARAIENQAYVAGVNRAGEGGGLRYVGDSAAIGPLGEIIAEAGEGETVLMCDVDPAVVAKLRARFPALEDVRPEAYRR